MRVEVAFEEETVVIDVPEERLVLSWHAPQSGSSKDVYSRVLSALEHPHGFPSLRKAIVPGDSVVLALGSGIPEPMIVLQAIISVLQGAGVETKSISVLAESDFANAIIDAIPPGLTIIRHDPEDREQLAYLAATSTERRVYLNRRLTDADFVLPIGRLAFDPIAGTRGPWDVIFPGLTDTEAKQAVLTTAGATSQAESAEVAWLLGCQFQVGLITGGAGLIEVVAGASESVLQEGMRALESAWTVRVESRAELVILGVGSPGRRSTITDVARGLATATKFVQRGGKVVVLSRAEGPIGPAFQRLIGMDDERRGQARLKGHETDTDYPAAQKLVDALAWADIYLLSKLGQDLVEDLSMIALDRPEEARRLAAVAESCLIVSQADQVDVIVENE